MMSVQESIQAGQLAEAISAATADVKRQPLRPEGRVVLAELMCFSGNLERADTLIETATKLESGPTPGLLLMRQLLRGEMARRQWYEEGRAPQTRSLPSPEFANALQTMVAYREGDRSAATKLADSIAQSSECAGIVKPTSGEQYPCATFRDLDDLSASVAELISPMGRFYWVPWRELTRLTFDPVKTLRDILWRPVECSFTDGTTERYFMPCLYKGSATATTDPIRMGQATDWTDLGEGLTSGVGLRMFLAGELTPSILEITEVEFDRAENDRATSN